MYSPSHPPEGCQGHVGRKRVEDVSLTSLEEGDTKNLKVGFRVPVTFWATYPLITPGKLEVGFHVSVRLGDVSPPPAEKTTFLGQSNNGLC